MLLYTCAGKKSGASTPVIQHPCGRAAKALDAAGHTYEIEVVGGFKNIPFTRGGKRDTIIELTGQEDVPVLVLDDGDTVVGAEAIVGWAYENAVAA